MERKIRRAHEKWLHHPRLGIDWFRDSLGMVDSAPELSRLAWPGGGTAIAAENDSNDREITA